MTDPAQLGAGLAGPDCPRRGHVTARRPGPVVRDLGSVCLRALTGGGDFDRDGFTDLMAVQSATGDLYRYPGRLVRHQRRLTLRLPPGDHPLPVVLTRIRDLNTAA